MAVLVTGGAGYIGSHMVHELRSAGEAVVVLDNLSTGFRNLIPSDVPIFFGEVGDQALVTAILGAHQITDIIHFAASIVVPESVTNPLSYYRNNTMAARNLIETAITSGIKRFVFSSTAAVYGNPQNIPVTENEPPAPISPYGTSKLMTEWILRDAAAAHDFHYVALRYFNVAGADPQLRTGQSTRGATHLIKVAVETALGQRSSMDIFGNDYDTVDGTGVRDYIHVSDLVSAHSAALSYLRSGSTSNVMNCGYGHGHSVLQVIEAVKRASGKDFDVRIVPRRAGDPASIVAGVDRIRQTLDWTPRYNDLSTIVQHALAWEKKLLSRNAPL